MKIKLEIENENGTIKLAKIISKYCFKGCVITLNGELGAGKTRFTKELGKFIGVSRNITSPTFNILKCYFDGKMPLYHIDAYRLEDLKQDLGLEEFIEGDGVCLIEWSCFIEYLLPSEYLDISIFIKGETSREIEISSKGEQYDNIVKGIDEEWK